MPQNQPPRTLEELVDRFDAAAHEDNQVSVDLMMDEVGRRSFGPLLLMAGVVMVAPIIGDIPGVPTLLGIFILLVSVQIVVGHDHFWLPQWLLRRSIASERVQKATRKWLRRPARAIDRVLQPRLRSLTGPVGMRAIAIACTVLALATPFAEFIPFSANGVGAGIVIFGLALIAHDGLMALIGWVVVCATVSIAAYVALG